MFDYRVMNRALMIVWAGLGIEIEDAGPAGNSDAIYCHFSVPKSSFHLGANGKEMSGKHLASRFKTTLEEMGLEFSDIRYRIREEHWTEDDGKCAEDAMRENLSNLDLFEGEDYEY